MLVSRDELVAALFRETDRAQRMKTALAVILFGIDNWQNWHSRLNNHSLNDAEHEIAARAIRLLRCYDVAGRYDDGVFGLVLPGCNSFNAMSMAERMRFTVFDSSVVSGEEDLRFSASFGVAGSGGRSPLVVLRNAENALRTATARGAGCIVRSSYDAESDSSTLLVPVIESDDLHW